MYPLKKIKVFSDRYPYIGPLMWMLSIQYFIVQTVVAADWSIGYSLSKNTISDLGNTTCGVYTTRFVCSPLHNLMNISFIVLGLFMTVGAVFIYKEFKKRTLTRLGFYLLGIAGFGTMVVGVFPENTVSFLHLTGAVLALLIGNVGIAVLGWALEVPKTLRVYSVISGSFSLVALLLYVSSISAGIGLGEIERLAAYPQTIWLIVFGLYMSKIRFIKFRKAISIAS